MLRMIALDHANAEIAERLYLSVRTVQTHRAHIQQQLPLDSRSELVCYALEHRPPIGQLRRYPLGRRQGGGRSAPGYCAAILSHCVWADCLTDAIGIFAAAVRQACLALLSAALTFALFVVI